MASSDFSLFAYENADSKKEKSPNALRTISEASEMLDVPQHVLRFWETKFSQIKPLKRNGGRRFYRPQDIDILQQIKHLLYSQGYTSKGAKKAVDDFIHARAAAPTAVTSSDWLAKVPPANSNDNFATEAPDMLSEIAQALTADEFMEMPAADAKPSVESLRTLRAELVSLRDALRVHLPAVSEAIQ